MSMYLEDPELVADFVTESREHLGDIENQLLQIEADAPDVDTDLVNTVFRGIHSIKGAAGFMGLTAINGLAHSLENVLGKIRNGELTPTPAIVDVMLRAADLLSGMINNIEESNSVDVSEVVEVLDAIDAGKEIAEPSEAEASTDVPDITETTDAEPVATVIESGDKQTGATAPPIESPVAESTEPLKAPEKKPAAGKKQSTEPSDSPAESSIRVNVSVLDKLMNLAGELVLSRNQLLQTINAGDISKVQTVGMRIDQVTSDLQEAIMQARMQPIGNVFSKFPRVVRDLSNRLSKKCAVHVKGNEVEIDKTIVEAIGDPLTHLIRNSIDHGLESPNDRVSAGKNQSGNLTLHAYHQAGKVRIDIIDDGRGIDPEMLKSKAVAKGVINEEQASRLSDRDAVRLIFHPGFSTAEKVSDVSGRGVGMDVVRTNIERLGGSVDIESTPGEGTIVQITLPLTLAIIPSMIVHCCGQRIAIPQVNVSELVRIRSHESDSRLTTVKGKNVLRLRGDLLPLIRLDRALDMPGAKEEMEMESPSHLIVVEGGSNRYGLVVDGIEDAEEIVVKPLGKHLKSCTALAGATILGDGHIAPILDVTGIASLTNLQAVSEEAKSIADSEQEQKGDAQSLLIFSNSPGDQFTVPMNLVSRIERVESSEIVTIAGKELLQYRGATLPLLSVDKLIKSKPRQEARYYYIVVYSMSGREYGLIAPKLDDCRTVTVDIDADTLHEEGVAGCMVLDGKTTRLLDLYELTRLANPQLASEKKSKAPAAQADKPVNGRPRVLIAEDSAFFRSQLRQYLTKENYEVLDFEDGQVAWQFLLQEGETIDLVVTDIEMPNMNGLALTGHIKDHAVLRRLPVIALTSLASEEDQRLGEEAGIDDYQIKMDRERLIAAASRLLSMAPPVQKTETCGA